MCLLRERLSDYQSKSLEWTKSYIKLIALYVHPKNSNHLRSPLRAIMALDHCRFNEKQILGKQIRPNFLRSTSLLYKILLTNLGACIHHIWGETIQTSERMQYFTILQYKLHSFNIQDDRSTGGLLAKPLKKFPKSTIRPAGSHLCSASCVECLNEHKEGYAPT